MYGYIYMIFLKSSHSEKSDKTYKKCQNKHLEVQCLSSRNRAIYEMIWKNIIDPNRLQKTIQYGICTLHAG